MRLNNIKLSGFKSFVDPTTVSFPSNLTGVVGPNGCGKSNIIDAVRWVMGESSAKHLRGESMADVIFNGSSSRKPVGQASIELNFDNSEGKIQGQYAAYNEISVKRVVGRDGTSNYYLNGTRCRRRDIMDVFLGTGLGPRSYAIIEQGMISRFIEAKPEEMRVFIEEAAGISKYKERRRETENRIKHTRENIERLMDLCEELEKQLEHLKRQANTAEKYKVLKQEERLVKAQLLALRRNTLHRDAEVRQQAINEQETAYEAQVAELRRIEADVEKHRELHIEATEAMSQVQAEYYQVGGDISGLEQSIQHNKEKRAELEHTLEKMLADKAVAQTTLGEDQSRITQLNQSLEEIEPLWQAAKETEQVSASQLADAEARMHDWQLDWEEFNRTAAEPAQAIEVERTRLNHLEQHIAQLSQRLERYREEQRGLSAEALQSEISQLQSQIDTIQAGINEQNSALQQCQQNIITQRDRNEHLGQQLSDERSDLQSTQGRLSSLEALQEAALGKRSEAVIEWLRERRLDEGERLAQVLDVEHTWQHAVETVLGFQLEAIGVDNLNDIGRALDTLEKGSVSVIERGHAVPQGNVSNIAATLLSKIHSGWSLESVFAGIYIADSLEQALDLRGQLQAHESIVTPEGIWIGPNWLRVTRDDDEKAGVLHREEEIKSMQQTIADHEMSIDAVQQELNSGRERLHELEQQRSANQAELDERRSQQADMQSSMMAKKAALEQTLTRSERIKNESGELERQIEKGKQDIEAATSRLQQAEAAIKELDVQRESLVARRDELRSQLDDSREQAREDHDAAHQHALKIEAIRTEATSIKQAMQRIENQITQFDNRCEEIRQLLADSEKPMADMAAELEVLLIKRVEVEDKLNASRAKVHEIEHNMRGLSEEASANDQKTQEQRTRLEQMRMDFQGLKVRLQTVEEQIDETGFALNELLEQLQDTDTEAEWVEKVESLERKIQRLGAINLAAIDEYNERLERKTYLDAQLADLNQALDTLENAMHKIDRETRTLFQETFDKINHGLKTTFPRLFGGGHANLELTGDDLLNAGVTIMARPPGKRIGSIHLMSGGEKALTAISMVFSIFQLNPAPFCLLDEVDAPLDDTNVGRFCDLVKEMSEKVQFIFITHNKVTMELAGHLTGVTMHEPGVSRPVAVDVDEAAAMAAS